MCIIFHTKRDTRVRNFIPRHKTSYPGIFVSNWPMIHEKNHNKKDRLSNFETKGRWVCCKTVIRFALFCLSPFFVPPFNFCHLFCSLNILLSKKISKKSFQYCCRKRELGRFTFFLKLLLCFASLKFYIFVPKLKIFFLLTSFVFFRRRSNQLFFGLSYYFLFSLLFFS
jgi:hypothetical protein